MSEEPGSVPRLASTSPRGIRFTQVLGGVYVACIIGVLVAYFLQPVGRGREAAWWSQCRNNLKQIGLALHQYADQYGALPPAYTVDAEGRPMHSWRTLILPYVDQAALYNSIDLTKPWDDPANEAAREAYPPIYICPSAFRKRNHTVYLANVAAGGCFRAGEPRRLAEITDGLSQTLMVIEVPADKAVHWMSPKDADEELILAIGVDLKPHHPGGMHVVLCDGSARFIADTIPVETRRALITIAAGDRVGDF